MMGGVAHLAGNSVRSPWKGVSVCPANRTTMRKFDDVEACDLLHQVATFYTSTKTPHDYGTGETFTSVELHTLKYIADHPGIAAVQIADDFGKTKSAVSQLLKKLEYKGLLVKTPSPDADHHQLLELSERGVQVNEAHKRYDAAHSVSQWQSLGSSTRTSRLTRHSRCSPVGSRRGARCISVALPASVRTSRVRSASSRRPRRRAATRPSRRSWPRRGSCRGCTWRCRSTCRPWGPTS